MCGRRTRAGDEETGGEGAKHAALFWAAARGTQRFVLGRDYGSKEDYGHGDLALGVHVGVELFEPIARFLGPVDGEHEGAEQGGGGSSAPGAPRAMMRVLGGSLNRRLSWFAVVALGCSSSDFAISQKTGDAEVETIAADTTVDDTGAPSDSTPPPDDTMVDTTVVGDSAIADVPVSACAAPGTELYVSPLGSNGLPANGSATCPFKTITRALVAATAFTKRINLHKGKYGVACEGGMPCDTSPIVVPITLVGLVIAGQGAVSDVTVAGDGDTVFDVKAPGVGFESMTIEPKKLAAFPNGGHGITYNAASAIAERSITKVEIRGTVPSDGVNGTGAAINLKSAASPMIGPDVKLTNGSYGVWAQASSRARISGTPTSPVSMTNFSGSCVRAAGIAPDRPSVAIDSGTSTSAGVMLAGCGGTGAIVLDTATGVTSTIDKVVINKGAANSGGIVVRSGHTLNASAVTVSNVLGTGFLATGNSVLNVERSSALFTSGAGLAFSDSTGTVGSFTAKSNASDGIRCEGASKVTLRGSELLLNSGNGLLVAGACLADVASTIFNKTSSRNAGAGLCFNSTAAAPSASGSTWSCKITTGCSSGAADLPTRAIPSGAAACAPGVDISEPILATVTATGAVCCN